jgi:hypothetical protein
MNNALAWIEKVFQDVDGAPSSKRVVVFLSILFLFGMAAVNTFWGFHVEQYIFETFRDIAIAAGGFSGLEKFSPRIKTAEA